MLSRSLCGHQPSVCLALNSLTFGSRCLLSTPVMGRPQSIYWIHWSTRANNTRWLLNSDRKNGTFGCHRLTPLTSDYSGGEDGRRHGSHTRPHHKTRGASRAAVIVEHTPLLPSVTFESQTHLSRGPSGRRNLPRGSSPSTRRFVPLRALTARKVS